MESGGLRICAREGSQHGTIESNFKIAVVSGGIDVTGLRSVEKVGDLRQLYLNNYLGFLVTELCQRWVWKNVIYMGKSREMD